jgi:hypothetical protein
MKNLSRLTLAVITVFVIMAFTSINGTKSTDPVTVTPKFEIVELPVITNSHVDFLQAIGQKESGNNYSTVNTYGYMGKYQFGASTLKGLGYKVSKKEFLNNPALQEEAMQRLLKHNRKKLKRQIEKYCGQVVNGVYITESGILAAAHLAGQGNVKKFFRKGYDFKDGYGTTMTSYMKKFNGYQLDL